jgi:hypothetical protein
MISANEVEGTEDVLASIRRFADLTGASLSEEIIRTARLVAVSVAHSTQPFGKDTATRDSAERRVAKEIGYVFTTPASVFSMIENKSGRGAAGTFWVAHKAGDLAAMKDVMDREGLGLGILKKPEKALHQTRRDKTSGRVINKNATHLVTDTLARERYIKQRQRKVGFAKSGWAAAADACGGHRGIPQWASSRHKGRAPGGAIISRDAVHPKVEIFNNVDYIDRVCDPTMISQAVEIAYEKLFKRIQILIRKGYADARLKAA